MEFYERLEGKQANQAETKDGFPFLDKDTYDKLPLTRWVENQVIPNKDILKFQFWREVIQFHHLLLRFDLVQQELTRLGINSITKQWTWHRMSCKMSRSIRQRS